MDAYSRADAAADLKLDVSEQPPGRVLRSRTRARASRPLALLGLFALLAVGAASFTSRGASGLLVHQAPLPGVGVVAEAAPAAFVARPTERAPARASAGPTLGDPRSPVLAAVPRLPIPAFGVDPGSARGSTRAPPPRRRQAVPGPATAPALPVPEPAPAPEPAPEPAPAPDPASAAAPVGAADGPEVVEPAPPDLEP